MHKSTPLDIRQRHTVVGVGFEQLITAEDHRLEPLAHEHLRLLALQQCLAQLRLQRLSLISQAGCNGSGVDGSGERGELRLHGVDGLRRGQIGAHEFGGEDEVGGVQAEEGEEEVVVGGESQREARLRFCEEVLCANEGLAAQRLGEQGHEVGERLVECGQAEVATGVDGVVAETGEENGEMIIQIAHGGVVVQELADDGLRVGRGEDALELLDEGGFHAGPEREGERKRGLEVVDDGGAEHAEDEVAVVLQHVLHLFDE